MGLETDTGNETLATKSRVRARAWAMMGIHPRDPALMLASSFIYFLCSQYLLTGSFLYNLGFYAVLLPVFILACVNNHSLIASVPRTIGTIGCLIFFVYVSIHALVWYHPEQDMVRTLGDTLFHAWFILIAFIVLQDEAQVIRMMRALVVVGLIAATLSILLSVSGGETNGARLLPIGRAHNPIPAGSAYAVVSLMAAYLFFLRTTSLRWKILTGASVVVITVMVALTECRGPMLSLAIGYGLMLLLSRHWKLALGGGLIFAGFMVDYIYFTTHGTSLLHAAQLHAVIQRIFESRDSWRLPIWEKALALITQRPWQGYGLQARFSLEGALGAVNPHNIFIGTAYYLGIPGLFLLLLPLISAFGAVLMRLRHGYNGLYLVLLVHAVAATLTNFGQVVKAPSAIWTIFWLPIILALAAQHRARQKVSVGHA